MRDRDFRMARVREETPSTIAVGVLIDTFLVRSLLVPALVLEIGDRVWWPSALAKVAGRRRERAAGDLAYETE